MSASALPIETSAEDIVVVCAWCRPEQILKMDVRPGDVFSFERINGCLRISRQRGFDKPFVVLPISHGICEGCKAKVLA